MSKYVGLTDHPQRRKQEHGNPTDWDQQAFSSETQARDWEARMLALGYKGGKGGEGWRYGYTYTIASSTVEE